MRLAGLAGTMDGGSKGKAGFGAEPHYMDVTLNVMGFLILRS